MTSPAINAIPLLYGRCNPYGAESGGPRRILGGLHGPNSARIDTDEVPGLPQNVIEGEWRCQWPAQVRVRMTCRCGHTGAVMDLCSVHDEEVYTSETVAGQIRRVKSLVRARGHYEEISRRQAGACPRCLYPGQYADWYKALFAWQQELGLLNETGGPQAWYGPRGNYIRQKIEDIVSEFDRGNASGEIHRCPMTLVPVS